MHRQINKMAWGYTSNWDFCVGVCIRHVPWMDFKVWRTCSDYKWQRSPVHFIPMVRHLLPAQDQAQDHHSFPPSVQRHGGKVPQAVKEFLTCSSSLLRLVWTPAMGFVRSTYISQRRLSHIRLGSSSWLCINIAWSIPRCARSSNQFVLWKP